MENSVKIQRFLRHIKERIILQNDAVYMARTDTCLGRCISFIRAVNITILHAEIQRNTEQFFQIAREESLCVERQSGSFLQQEQKM